MKLIIIFCALFSALAAQAQTNTTNIILNTAVTNRPRAVYVAPVLPPGYAALAGVSNQIAALEKKIAGLEAEQNLRDKKFHLRVDAKQGSVAENQAYFPERTRWRNTQIEPLRTQIAGLRLKEFEIRQRYKISEVKAERKKR